MHVKTPPITDRSPSCVSKQGVSHLRHPPSNQERAARINGQNSRGERHPHSDGGPRRASAEPSGTRESPQHRCRDSNHCGQHAKVAVSPAKFGHVVEIHAVEAFGKLCVQPVDQVARSQRRGHVLVDDVLGLVILTCAQGVITMINAGAAGGGADFGFTVTRNHRGQGDRISSRRPDPRPVHQPTAVQDRQLPARQRVADRRRFGHLFWFRVGGRCSRAGDHRRSVRRRISPRA